jgi:uncharacterized membrane protein (DUF106 family)
MLPLTAILDVGMKILDKVIPNPAEKAKAQVALMEMQQKGELAQLEADLKEQEELTKRLQADMTSDSWLSKNIRPMSLIAVFAAYFLFAMMSAYGHNANEVYVTLLGQWGMLIFSFYFGSRGMEKIAEMWSKKK